MRQRYYLGRAYPKKEVFRSASTPAPTSHPEYRAVVGPFRTKRAALFMATQYGNPHCQSVADAERIAKEIAHATIRK